MNATSVRFSLLPAKLSKLINRSIPSLLSYDSVCLKNNSSTVVNLLRTSISHLHSNDRSFSYNAHILCNSLNVVSQRNSLMYSVFLSVTLFCSITLQVKDFSLYPFLSSIACCIISTDYPVLALAVECRSSQSFRLINLAHFSLSTLSVYICIRVVQNLFSLMFCDVGLAFRMH
jgi:hypothetical protein